MDKTGYRHWCDMYRARWGLVLSETKRDIGFSPRHSPTMDYLFICQPYSMKEQFYLNQHAITNATNVTDPCISAKNSIASPRETRLVFVRMWKGIDVSSRSNQMIPNSLRFPSSNTQHTYSLFSHSLGWHELTIDEFPNVGMFHEYSWLGIWSVGGRNLICWWSWIHHSHWWVYHLTEMCLQIILEDCRSWTGIHFCFLFPLRLSFFLSFFPS